MSHSCAPLGYANEVGEAFRALVPVSMVWASYAVATAYVSADAVDKGKKAAAVSVWIYLWKDQELYCYKNIPRFGTSQIPSYMLWKDYLCVDALFTCMLSRKVSQSTTP